MEKTESSRALDDGNDEPACCGHGSAGLPPTATPSLSGDSGKLLPAAAGADALRAYMAAVNAPGALDTKSKKLIGLALSIVTRCEPCVKLHAQAARAAGATDAELAEVAALGIAFGGAAANMFYQKCRD